MADRAGGLAAYVVVLIHNYGPDTVHLSPVIMCDMANNEDWGSSDLEISEFNNLYANRGAASLESMLEDATKHQKSSKIASKQLTLTANAPGT